MDGLHYGGKITADLDVGGAGVFCTCRDWLNLYFWNLSRRCSHVVYLWWLWYIPNVYPSSVRYIVRWLKPELCNYQGLLLTALIYVHISLDYAKLFDIYMLREVKKKHYVLFFFLVYCPIGIYLLDGVKLLSNYLFFFKYVAYVFL